MGQTVDVIEALVPLGGPIAFVAIALIFSKEIRSLLQALPSMISRVRTADILGVKFELLELKRETEAARKEVERGELRITTDVQQTQPSAGTAAAGQRDAIALIRSEAAISKRSALIRTAAFIEKEVKALLAPTGLMKGYVSPSQAGHLLEERLKLPGQLKAPLDRFFAVRNEVAHNPNHPELTEETLEAGISLLSVLRSIPRPRFEVVAANFPLYSDPNATQLREGVSGVILRGFDEAGRGGQTQAFPTTKPMRQGSSVTWEWNMGNSWGKSWYRDPISSEICHAFDSAAEFIGRDLEDL